MARKTRIVVVGGGAAGLALARKLAGRAQRHSLDVVLVDRNRTHIWKPLLHEVATGALDASIEEVGYRGHCHRWGYRFYHGELEGIDRVKRLVNLAPVRDLQGQVIGTRHAVPYDYLVLALGSVTNTFGTSGVEENCIFLDSHRQADLFRERLLRHCLAVSRELIADSASNSRLKVAIVGAGATGVELAAELVNAADGMKHYGLPSFDRSRIAVLLIEAGPRILPALPDWLATDAHHELESLGVEVRTGTAIGEATRDGMVTRDGERIAADIQIWAAGVKGQAIEAGLDGLELTSAGQIIVTPTLQAVNDERIFAIGDCASCILQGESRPVPPRAQAAHQMASATLNNLIQTIRGQPLQPFRYRDHGSLVSLSRYSAVGSLMGNLVGGRMSIEGRAARFVYVGLYRMHLIAIHGWTKGLAMIAMAQINRIMRPRLKIH